MIWTYYHSSLSYIRILIFFLCKQQSHSKNNIYKTQALNFFSFVFMIFDFSILVLFYFIF